MSNNRHGRPEKAVSLLLILLAVVGWIGSLPILREESLNVYFQATFLDLVFLLAGLVIWPGDRKNRILRMITGAVLVVFGIYVGLTAKLLIYYICSAAMIFSGAALMFGGWLLKIAGDAPPENNAEE